MHPAVHTLAEPKGKRHSVAVKEKHSLASTKLLQLRPEVVRVKNYVIAFRAGDPIQPTWEHGIACPYDYIAIGSDAAFRLAKAGKPVVAIYLPSGESVSELVPPEMLIGVEDLTAANDLEGRNYIVLDDNTFSKSYSHVQVASGSDNLLLVRRLAGILNYKNVRSCLDLSLDLPRLHLMVQLWKPKQGRRFKELVTCLRKNLENPFIKAVHVFIEGDEELYDFISKFPLELRQKVVNYDSCKRFTYKDIMKRLIEIGNERDIVGFANADIFFDETIRELWNIDLHDRCITLLRHDCSSAWASGEAGAAEPRLYGPRDDSQDAWFFSAASLKQRKEAGESWASLDFEVGQAGCHNCFAGELIRRRWVLGNPAFTIKAYHLHESPERTYNETDLVSRGVYATVAPCALLESALLRQNAFPNRIPVKMMDTLVPVVEKWLGSDSAPYERGLKSIMASVDSSKPNCERTYNIISTKDVCITPEGLISSINGIGFGFDTDTSELLWAQTSFNSISPTIPVDNAVFFPSMIETNNSFGHQLWNAARAATIWKSGHEIAISGAEPLPAMQPYLKFLGVKYIDGVLSVKGEARGLLPDAANHRLLEPVVNMLRETLGKSLLGDICVKPGTWTTIGCNDDLIDSIDTLGIDIHALTPNSWIGKFMRQLRESEVVVVGHPNAIPNLWMMHPGTLVLDINPTIAAARMATACDLRYMPFIFDNEGEDEMARILVKGTGGFSSAAAKTGLPKIYVPAIRADGFHKHLGDGFRELVELWAERGFVERIFHDGVFCWYNSIGDILLYDRRNDDWLQTDVPEGEKTFKKILKIEEFMNWGRRPRLLVSASQGNERSKNIVFYGHIETARHFRARSVKATGIDWSSVCDGFELPVGSKYKYTPSEYLKQVSDAHYGLCLPGTGVHTNREAEYMALGVVPIFVGGSAPSKTGSQTLCGAQATSGLQKGVHYLEAATPEEASAITKSAPWVEMSAACRQFYQDNWSPEASWHLLQNHCTL